LLFERWAVLVNKEFSYFFICLASGSSNYGAGLHLKAKGVHGITDTCLMFEIRSCVDLA
jgi:hypothetical protein